MILSVEDLLATGLDCRYQAHAKTGEVTYVFVEIDETHPTRMYTEICIGDVFSSKEEALDILGSIHKLKEFYKMLA